MRLFQRALCWMGAHDWREGPGTACTDCGLPDTLVKYDGEMLFVARRKTDGRLYRGVKLWRWTRFKRFAAVMSEDDWRKMAKQLEITEQILLHRVDV